MQYLMAYAMEYYVEERMRTAKIFKNGRSQAVRIPKDFAFKGVTELTVRKVGKKLILEPARKSWLTLNNDSEPVDDDFLADRPDIFGMGEDRFLG